jgi:hypothetical protein
MLSAFCGRGEDQTQYISACSPTLYPLSYPACKATVWLLTFNFIHFMATFWAVFTFGGSGPAITAHGSLDLKQEIHIQIQAPIRELLEVKQIKRELVPYMVDGFVSGN